MRCYRYRIIEHIANNSVNYSNRRQNRDQIILHYFLLIFFYAEITDVFIAPMICHLNELTHCYFFPMSKRLVPFAVTHARASASCNFHSAVKLRFLTPVCSATYHGRILLGKPAVRWKEKQSRSKVCLPGQICFPLQETFRIYAVARIYSRIPLQRNKSRDVSDSLFGILCSNSVTF